jgi:hypothetical protein
MGRLKYPEERTSATPITCLGTTAASVSGSEPFVNGDSAYI